MGKTIADIRRLSDRVERRFVSHRRLRALHRIDRATANAKCDARAEAARAALPVLRQNNCPSKRCRGALSRIGAERGAAQTHRTLSYLRSDTAQVSAPL